MTLEHLSRLVDSAWPDSPWTQKELHATLALPTTRLMYKGGAAFLMAQVIAPEAEIVLIATDPAHRRQGLAQSLIYELQLCVAEITLEVRADNTAAIALYEATEFEVVGHRPDYYSLQNGRKFDGLIMRWTSPGADDSQNTKTG